MATGLTRLLEAGALAGRRSLSLWDRGLRDEDVDELARCDALRELTSLDLGWNQIGPAGARALATSPVLANLEWLNLYHNDILDEGACALAAAQLPRLRGLNMCRNGLTPRAAAAIRRDMPELRKLHAGCNALGDDGIAMLATLEHLEELNVRKNGIGPDGATTLADARPPLRVLGLEDNPIGDRGVGALVDSGLLGATSVAVLIDVGLGEAGLARIAKRPREARGALRIGLNALGDAGVATLVDGPGVDGLTELGMPCNDITDRGARLLADAPFVRSLDVLDLVGNDIGFEMRTALAASLRPGALKIDLGSVA
jgi:Ran GTPase-activating protein (RanGAP) involved in mRNA processing and transport